MTDNFTRTGGPAFPVETTSTPWAEGLSIRDWFAGHALAGFASSASAENIKDLAEGVMGGKFLAGAAYQLADAMIEAREVQS